MSHDPSLSQARAIIAGTLAAGTAAVQTAHRGRPRRGGHVLAAEREDGSSNKRFEVAHGKAHGAVSMGMGSRSLMGARAAAYFVAAVTSGRSARSGARRRPGEGG